MDGPDLQHIPVSLQNLQSASLHAITPETSLGSQLTTSFDPNDPQPFQPFPSAIGNIEQQHLQTSGAFVRPPRPGEPPNLFSQQGIPPRLQQLPVGDLKNANNGNCRFSVPPPRPGQEVRASNSHANHNTSVLESRENQLELLQSLQQPLQSNITAQIHKDVDLIPSTEPATEKLDGHFHGMKVIPEPPDLQLWREKLFNVNTMITLTEDEFQTYFPHVDNVYSHRSTQKYKRKPFISHYWDCRLKGRPPGTPKSNDPNKKKRRRTARQRDLCDVKIKITEYFPGADTEVGNEFEVTSSDPPNASSPDFSHNNIVSGNQPFGVLTPNLALPEGHPGASGARYFTIQRVNGSAGNGKADGMDGGHRHTLEESDRVKRNSVQRFLMKEAKDKKKTLTQQKTYHKKATGLASFTVKKHSKECDLKLYGGCFCPFVQRVWIALEAKKIPYQYIEVDPYKKPESLLAVNPRGLVPALQHGNWGCYESTVLLEYLEDLGEGIPLLPPGDPKLRAYCRIWADHVNRHIVPSFYRVLQEQDPQKQTTNARELWDEICKLVNASHIHGPFFLGRSMSFVDVQVAPWVLRLSRVLKPYRGWPDPEQGSRWAAWVNAIEDNDCVKATTSGDELYLDSYERYAENRPDTSQLANAINAGRGLP